MVDKQQRVDNLSALLDFVENAPTNEEIIAMDCNDHCENMAKLAEQVANGARLEDVLPELQEHMKYWGDCREEFIALVSVLKAEMSDELPLFEDE
ncbi:MAG: hypothetical protein Q9P01_18615 [Anaerolineae bacterium]|nr:hypothetical protein [Anaerolineae bacterium]MDQ7036767.1 hypothetical protein [Anaerolineae bacterium]